MSTAGVTSIARFQELAHAGDVGQRFASDAPGDQAFERLMERGRDSFVAVRHQARRIPAEDVLGQQARIECGFVSRNAGRAETAPCVGDERVDVGRHRSGSTPAQTSGDGRRVLQFLRLVIRAQLDRGAPRGRRSSRSRAGAS
ncbi:MAG: hypothetical protein QM736_29270 [Vicinamibacterales bacterium]